MALAAVLAGIAAALFWGNLRDLHSLETAVTPPWWVFVPVFVFTELFAVHLRMGANAHAVTLREIPIATALACLSPIGYLAALLLGSSIAFAMRPGSKGVKIVFNLALFALEAAVAISLYRLLLGPAQPSDLRGWGATAVAIVATDLLATIAVSGAIFLSERRLDLGVVRAAATSGLLATVPNTGLGLLAVVLLHERPLALALLSVVFVTLFLSYRAYTALSTGYGQLGLLYEFTRTVGRSVHTDVVLADVLMETRHLLQVEVAELMLLGGKGNPAHHLRLAGDAGAAVVVPEGGELPWWATAGAGDGLLLPHAARDRSVRERLATAGYRDAMAVPMRADDGVLGVLLAANRLGEVSTFSTEDLRLFETLANHASVAVQNGRLVDRLHHEALHDPLTGLPNRRRFAEQVDAATTTRSERGRNVAVLLMDLDRFQEVNDALGHHTGDVLLREVGVRLAALLPGTATIARLGGDEFAVLLPDMADGAAAEAAGAELLTALEAPFVLGDVRLVVGASIGISLAPDHGRTAAALLQRADVAMYEAKARHGGVAVYRPDADINSARRLALATDLRHAVEDGELEVWYQPKAAAATAQVIGVEALVRWNHPRFGRVAPDEFITLAERTGVISTLTRHVLDVALGQRAVWAADHRPLGVAVNLSMRSLLDHGLSETVQTLLARHGVPPESLTLEITETSLMGDPARSVAVLEQLRDIGVRLSIDDFGTGYSSLAYLRKLPVHEVKVDKSFVLGVTTSPGDAAIVRSTIRLGHDLGLSVVAEGVETEATRQWLAETGCDVIQGYLLSRPIPAEAFTRWLAASEKSLVPAPR